MALHHPRTPVIVGVGRFTQYRGTCAYDPIELMAEAAKQAAADSHAVNAEGIWRDLGGVATVQMYLERRVSDSLSRPRYVNPARSLKQALRAEGKEFIAATSSGNSPQMLVNELAERISTGEMASALVCGCEALATFSHAEKRGKPLPTWGDELQEEAAPLPASGAEDYPVTEQEEHLGIGTPRVAYALFDAALRRSRNASVEKHMAEVGDIFSGFSHVASSDDQARHAWFPTFRTPTELCEPSASNRMVCFPYTKRLNSVMDVDMSAGGSTVSGTKHCLKANTVAFPSTSTTCLILLLPPLPPTHPTTPPPHSHPHPPHSTRCSLFSGSCPDDVCGRGPSPRCA
jgi:acetyl-CoA C-acetyltransferase